ncbi:hypothetical protein F5878DRAFT_616712 [Lentinula raphanica]|uniref:Secreted protein n=1 Tax=Lentinula raphanica TaxID=153919 RepID=A0AA38PAJ4_9AGAR|nr:hypothetical protein F5878DRAFT_616712 [Lentinula raphanica]
MKLYVLLVRLCIVLCLVHTSFQVPRLTCRASTTLLSVIFAYMVLMTGGTYESHYASSNRRHSATSKLSRDIPLEPALSICHCA